MNAFSKKKIMKKLALACLLLLGACSKESKPKAQHIIDTSQAMPYVFVLSSPSGIYSEDVLTLKPVPAVVYFSDRPHLVAGHLTMKDFVEKWSGVKKASSDETPNAVLSVLDQDKTTEFILELAEPKLSEDQLQMKVLKVDGKLPTTFGTNSIFIEMKGLNVEKSTEEPSS